MTLNDDRALRPTRPVSGTARCLTCGAELEDAAERFCGGDRCLQVLARYPE